MCFSTDAVSPKRNLKAQARWHLRNKVLMFGNSSWRRAVFRKAPRTGYQEASVLNPVLSQHFWVTLGRCL